MRWTQPCACSIPRHTSGCHSDVERQGLERRNEAKMGGWTRPFEMAAVVPREGAGCQKRAPRGLLRVVHTHAVPRRTEPCGYRRTRNRRERSQSACRRAPLAAQGGAPSARVRLSTQAALSGSLACLYCAACHTRVARFQPLSSPTVAAAAAAEREAIVICLSRKHLRAWRNFYLTRARTRNKGVPGVDKQATQRAQKKQSLLLLPTGG